MLDSSAHSLPHSSHPLRVLCLPFSEIITLTSQNFLHEINLEGSAPTLVLIYKTTVSQNITRSALCEFRASALDRDEVFQSEFFQNVVFYGSKKADPRIEPGALDELASWDVKTQTFIEGNPAAKVAPGPYVFVEGRTWQPWRVYHDFNGCFMTSFKPSQDARAR